MESSRRQNNISILAITTLAISFFSAVSHADVGIGAIATDTQIEGKGDFEINSGVNVGDTIATGAKGNVTILFDDESMLTLGPNAKAQIVKFSETPAPGVSEIKIISGGFRYFPGIILENGGQQVLNNIGGTSTTDNIASGPDVAVNAEAPLNDENLSALNEQLTDINQLNVGDLVSSTELQNTADTGGSTSGVGEGGKGGFK